MKQFTKYRESVFITKHDNRTSNIIKHFNNVLKLSDSGVYDPIILYWLTKYMHSSYMYSKQNFDGTYLNIQPGWPDKIVNKYMSYYDSTMEYAHKSSVLCVYFTDNTMTEISLYKFKKYLRKQFQVTNIK